MKAQPNGIASDRWKECPMLEPKLRTLFLKDSCDIKIYIAGITLIMG